MRRLGALFLLVFVTVAAAGCGGADGGRSAAPKLTFEQRVARMQDLRASFGEGPEAVALLERRLATETDPIVRAAIERALGREGE